MGDMAWKSWERIICRAFGGERSGPVGKDGPDCTKDTHPFAVQCKHRVFPKWLWSFVEQTVRDTPKGEIPTLVMHPKGGGFKDCLVVIPIENFLDWYGE